MKIEKLRKIRESANCEWCGIYNGRTILKFADFCKNSVNLLIFKFWEIQKISNLKNSENFYNSLISEMIKFWKLFNLKN